MKSTKIAEKTEEISEKFIDKFKPYLPSIARICLCATFIEDSLRMITQFSDERPTFFVNLLVYIDAFLAEPILRGRGHSEASETELAHNIDHHGNEELLKQFAVICVGSLIRESAILAFNVQRGRQA